ncbi:MAG TPA: beta-glucosidase [Planctomycetota bacterium]
MTLTLRSPAAMHPFTQLAAMEFLTREEAPTQYRPVTRPRTDPRTRAGFHLLRWLIAILGAGAASACFPATTYYVGANGIDTQSGTSPEQAWCSIAKVNTVSFATGDSILFEAGQTFTGRIYLDAKDAGTADAPITLSSWGTGRATIDGGASNAFYAYNTGGLNILNLNFRGSGAETNTGAALVIFCDLAGDVKLSHIYVDSVEISDFRNGILIAGKSGASGYNDVRITNAVIHDNRCDGLRTWGAAKYALTNVYVGHCEFFNNTGDPTLTTNSGSGAVLGQVDGGIVERCLAHGNGALCTSEDGPCGLWCHDSNNMLIQSNESWNNHTGGINDGGGADLDGATTHSILQYNYTHDNDGAGLGLFQYSGAGPWSNNIVRYNVSENDGRKNGFAGLQVCNKGSGMLSCEIYNNTIFTSGASNGSPRAVWFVTDAAQFHLRNNIFMTTDGIPIVDFTGQDSGWLFQNNLYWAGGDALNIQWNGLTFANLPAWRAYTGEETMDSVQLGLYADPLLVNPGAGGTIGNADALETFTAYALQSASPAIDAALNLTKSFSIDPGPRDFFGTAIPRLAFDIGACEFSGDPAPRGNLTLSAFKASASTSALQTDSVNLVATLAGLPADFSPAGQMLSIDVSGATFAFTLSSRSNASSAQGKVRLKRSRSVPPSPQVTAATAPGAVLAVTLSHGTWAQTWLKSGMLVSSDKAVPDIRVSIVVGGKTFAATVSGHCTSKNGKYKVTK